MIVDCADFESDPDFPGCCYSCHEDWNEGWAPPNEGDVILPDGRSAHLCCTLRLWLLPEDT